MEKQDILKYAIEHGLIDMSYVQEQIEMNKRKELLEKHPYDIWKENEGNWHTYLPDTEKGPIPKKSKSKHKVEQDAIFFL